jgi:hypothetical protein
MDVKLSIDFIGHDADTRTLEAPSDKPQILACNDAARRIRRRNQYHQLCLVGDGPSKTFAVECEAPLGRHVIVGGIGSGYLGERGIGNIGRIWHENGVSRPSQRHNDNEQRFFCAVCNAD